MHRSGTSAITGMLAQAGFAAPTDQMPANIVNPKGFWESLSIARLNEDFLEKNGKPLELFIAAASRLGRKHQRARMANFAVKLDFRSL
jgi:hypothetical protein